MRVKRNFHQIWNATEKPLVKRGPVVLLHELMLDEAGTPLMYGYLDMVTKAAGAAFTNTY